MGNRSCKRRRWLISSTKQHTTEKPSSSWWKSWIWQQSPKRSKQVLNLDIMSDSTPDLHHQGLSTPSCPTSSVRGGRSKQSVSRKRNVDGSQKSMTKTTKQMSEGRSSSPGYSTMLKELTNAVKETPPLPRTDKLDKWGEVLVLDLCEFPIEIQHEARHHINEYVMNLRRSYALTACLQTTADIQRLLLLQVMRPKQLQGFRLPQVMRLHLHQMSANIIYMNYKMPYIHSIPQDAIITLLQWVPHREQLTC